MDGDGYSRNGNSTDLFYEFMTPKNGESGAENDEEMELNLGLSTNGRFGVDPMRENLRRSSSSSDVVVTDNSVGNGKARAVAFGSDAPLVRASSLPSEFETHRQEVVVQNPRSLVVNEHGNRSADSDGNRLHVDANGIPRPQEATHNPMTRGSSSHQFLQERAVERPAGAAPFTPTSDMPYVTTRGLGPKSEQIKGFLYRYRRGEDVKIVCVCHGLFLSPAEFVKHGGGGDVHNPLKHIVVTPFPIFD